MISLADLRARKVTPIWQESVAVVQELIQTVKATTGSAELLPDLGHVSLIPNGDVVALPGSAAPANPVRHAAVMLQLLIEGVPAPPELEQFVARNVAASPQYDSVAEFSRNLAFFERPGRRSDVERLVARALAAEQTSRAEEELQRLKERAGDVTQVMAPPEFLQEQQKVKTVPIAVVAAIGVVIIGAGLWLWSQVRANQAPASAPASAGATAGQAPPVEPGQTASGPASTDAAAGGTAPNGSAGSVPANGIAGAPGAAAGASTPGSATGAATAPTAAQGDRSLLDRASDAVRSAVNSLSGTAASPAPAVSTTPAPSTEAKMAAAPPPPAPPRPRRTPKKAVVAPAVTPAPPAAVAAAPSAPVVVPPTPESVPMPISVEAAPANTGPLAEEEIEVFTAADSTVTPAVIVRPVLPKEPPLGVPPEKIGTIDVIVDEQGDVVRVKLISPGNRYHERMLVSAAKMWKFRPAYKDGRPVRYKARVRLTI
jgi:hypothetical protein